MKQRKFKIIDTTLFVYKKQKTFKTGETETDPTTTMITITKTGF